MIHKIILFLIFFISGGAIINIGIAGFFYPVFLLVLFITLIAANKKIKLPFKSFLNICILGGIFIGLMIIRKEGLFYEDNFNIILKFIILLILCVYISTFYIDTKEFYAELLTVFEFLLKLSLITFVLTNLLPFLIVDVGKKLEVTGVQYQTFLGIAFTRTTDRLKYGFCRNQGIFWEPGVFGVMIILMYIIKIFYLKETRNIKLYYICLISTFSMGAILIFFLLFILKKIFRGSSKQFETNLPLLFIIVGLPLIVLMNLVYLYSSDVTDFLSIVFHRDLSNDNSVRSRYQDLYFGFLAARNRIFFGHGQDFTDYYRLTLSELNTSKESYGGGITNAMVSMLYCFGIVFFLFFLSYIFKTAKAISPYRRYVIVIFLTFVGLLMIEPLQFSLLLLLIICLRESKKMIIT